MTFLIAGGIVIGFGVLLMRLLAFGPKPTVLDERRAWKRELDETERRRQAFAADDRWIA